eukprot:2776340-Amphidinium_carterae.1
MAVGEIVFCSFERHESETVSNYPSIPFALGVLCFRLSLLGATRKKHVMGCALVFRVTLGACLGKGCCIRFVGCVDKVRCCRVGGLHWDVSIGRACLQIEKDKTTVVCLIPETFAKERKQ